MLDESLLSMPAPFEVRLPVLGIMTTFASDSAAVRDAIAEAYGRWSELPASVVTDSATRVCVLVNDASAGRPEAADPAVPAEGAWAPRYRIDADGRLVVDADGAIGLADAARNESVAYVSRALAHEPTAVVEHVVEPLTLFLLGVQDRQPLHAGAIARGGVGLLLAGPSGSGKSSLAYAARRAGFDTLADEPVYIQSRSELRVWGRRDRLHLPVESREHFPELRDLEPQPLPTGKRKIVIPETGGAVRYTETAGICLLVRDEHSAPDLEAMAVDAVVEALTRELDPGYDLFGATIGESIARVAEGGAWALRWSGGPQRAIPLLERAIAEVGGA